MPDLPPFALDLSARLGAEVAAIRPLAGGACQDNFRVDLSDGRTFALRSDARSALPGSLSRAAEAVAIDLAVAAGVPTPAVRHRVDGLIRPDATALLMDWAEGVAIAAKVLRDPALAAARERLPEQLAAALAAVHAVRPGPPIDSPLSSPASAVATTLAFTRATLDALPDPHPAMELVLRWLGDHRPPERDSVLVHGDFRTGNFLVGPDGLVALLDWEFAHWGSPAADLGWLMVRDWRFGQLHLAAGGFATRQRFLEAYAAAGGQPVTPEEVRWWEILGNLRWAAGAAHQTQRVLSGAEGDLELLVIGRRACEMSYEALRLIEHP